MASTDPVALTQALVRYKTVNPPGEEHDCAHHLGEMLAAAGFTVDYHEADERRTNVVARLGNGEGKPLCFTGHIDTVPLGARPWRVDPFGGEIIDGKLYGRGATDMKAGVAAFVSAAIDQADVLAKGPGVVMVITSGEETGCEGAFHLTAQADLLGEAGAMVVAEPTRNYPLIGHKGALWLSAISHGVTAHGSTPEHGDNAIYKAARMVGALECLEFGRPVHGVLGRDTLNVGTIAGGMNMNSVPDVCRVGIDIRTTPGASHVDVRQKLESCLGADLAKLEILIDLEGVWTDPGEPWIVDVYAVMADLLGEPPTPRGAAFFTDASALTPYYGGIPTIVLGPGEAALAHQTDEYCCVDRITQAKTAYGALMQRWISP
jgi:succinyl-diaminopimelate desuccinylase